MTVADLPAPDAWGVGRLTGAGRIMPWPVSAADVSDEAESAAAHLDTIGIERGDLVLLVSLLSQSVHVSPIEMAINARGALFSSADSTPGDCFRVIALVDRLRPRAVLGISEPTLEGFAELGRTAAEVLATVPVVATTDEASHRALTDAGLAPRRWLRVGPANAFECERGDGAHVDGGRWRVSAAAGGRVRITGLVPRLTPANELATGLRGVVVDEPCPCGRPGPRILPTEVG